MLIDKIDKISYSKVQITEDIKGQNTLYVLTLSITENMLAAATADSLSVVSGNTRYPILIHTCVVRNMTYSIIYNKLYIIIYLKCTIVCV